MNNLSIGEFLEEELDDDWSHDTLSRVQELLIALTEEPGVPKHLSDQAANLLPEVGDVLGEYDNHWLQ